MRHDSSISAWWWCRVRSSVSRPSSRAKCCGSWGCFSLQTFLRTSSMASWSRSTACWSLIYGRSTRTKTLSGPYLKIWFSPFKRSISVLACNSIKCANVLGVNIYFYKALYIMYIVMQKHNDTILSIAGYTFTSSHFCIYFRHSLRTQYQLYGFASL